GLPRAVWDGLTVKGYNGDVDSNVVDFMFTVYGESDLKDVAEELDLAYPPESDEDRKHLVKVYFDDLVDSATQLFESEADKLPDYVRNNSLRSTRPQLAAHRHTSVHTGTHRYTPAHTTGPGFYTGAGFLLHREVGPGTRGG